MVSLIFDVRLNNARPVDRHEVKQVVSIISHRWPSSMAGSVAREIDAVVDGSAEDDMCVQIVTLRPGGRPRLAPLQQRLMPGFQQGEQHSGLNADRVGVPRVINVFCRGHRESP